jgi:hypothetical protein
VIDFDDFGQSVQEIFRAVQGVDVRLGSIFVDNFKGVEHNSRNAKNAGLLANSMTFMVGNGLAYDYAADMPCSQNLHGRIGRGNWYDPIPSMRQNRIADG